MGVDERDVRRTTADVHFQMVGEKPGYAPTASGPVRYRRIVWRESGTTIGYLWYSDPDNAAGYVGEATVGDDAINAGGFWYKRLAEAGERGLRPSEAVAEFEEQGVGSRGAGWIVPDSDAEAPSLADVEAAEEASSGGERPSQPPEGSRRRERGA